MAKEIDIYQIDAFSTEAFKGNPAGVTSQIYFLKMKNS